MSLPPLPHSAQYFMCDVALQLFLWLKQQKLVFSQFWKLKSKIKVSARLVSSEDSLLGLQMFIFLLCPQMVTSWSVYARECVQISSSYKDNSYSGLAPP